MKQVWIILIAAMFIVSGSNIGEAKSHYKIKHKDQITNDWEIHVDYPLFDQLEDKDLQQEVNTKIVQKLEDTFRDVKRGAGDLMGMPVLYYEETGVYREKDLYSVVMTSHISRGEQYNSTVTSVNFKNTDQGKVVPLAELVDMEELNKRVQKVITQEPDTYNTEKFNKVRDNTAFYVADDQLFLIFNKYEIAAGVHGTPEIQIPLNGMELEQADETNAPFPSFTLIHPQTILTGNN
ncbi:RsiV family protein [Halobacillus sp. K22]|uniref:RsiV family protein n=1 Tax=Halobacillus sp. K22 TaxID=3457431 RepID=UPI003FCD5482